MEAIFYNGERYERNQRWYIIFISIFIFIIVLSLIFQNFTGVILLFFLMGGYLMFSIKSTMKIKIRIEKEGLRIDNKYYSYNIIRGYILEIDPYEKVIKNIIFVFDHIYLIHTIADKSSNIKQFILTLDEIIPQLGDFHQSSIDKIIRKLKL